VNRNAGSPGSGGDEHGDVDRESRADAPAGTRLDRLLRLFSDVRAGEGLLALVLTLDIFLILSAYYVLKPVREALILAQGSAELKSYLSAGQVLLLAGLVPLYGKLTELLPRRRLITWVTLFFTGCLVVFYGLGKMGVPLGIPFFLWIGIFNLMIVAQFWSFANDVYTEGEGERLFPIVAFGASSGAVAGAVLSGRIIEAFGVYNPMLVGGLILVIALQLTNWVDERARSRPGPTGEGDPGRRGAAPGRQTGAGSASEDGSDDPTPVASREEEPPEGEPVDGAAAAFGLLLRNRYLLLIAFMILLTQWVNTTGEYILSRVVEDAAREAVRSGGAAASVETYIGSFYSDFFSVVNVLALVVQAFLVSRVIKYLGVGAGLLLLPILAIGVYGIIAFVPVLGAVRWAKTAENATDYSLQNTLRHALFLVTSRAEKYAGKQAIDSFFWRAGDVLSALLVFVGTTFLALQTRGFALFNLGLVAVWLVLAVWIGRQYERRREAQGIDEEEIAPVAA